MKTFKQFCEDNYITRDLARREKGKTFSRKDIKFSVQHMGKTKKPSEVTPSYMPFIPSKGLDFLGNPRVY